MAVTIKKIAELCGVSRGTVDRVLNGRGKVKPETEAAVRKMAAELGYQPNPAGKALAARKHRPVVGVLLANDGNPFFDDVITGIKRSEEIYRIYGLKVLWRSMKGYSVDRQCMLQDEMRGQINALIVSPINDERIAAKIDALVDEGVFVVTINTDIESCRRHVYVGSDYFNGGETACALLELLTGGQADIGLVLGSSHVLGHQQRLEGFRQRMARVPGFRLLGVVENEDDDIFSYERMRELLTAYPTINAVFLAAGGVYGACRALLSTPAGASITAVAFDSVPSTVDMMKQGVLQAILYQHPYRQGRKSMDIVFDYLVNGISPKREKNIMKNEIKLLENL